MDKKITGTAVLAVAVFCAVFFSAVSDGKKGAETGTAMENGSTETAVTEETEAAETEPTVLLPVDEEEEELLAGLYVAMEKKDLSLAAKLLNGNQETLKQLVKETLGGKRYLFFEEEGRRRMEELSRIGEGRGLVLSRFNTAFFGNFKAGRPEGDCTAIQAMVLKQPRYTFAAGEWKQGKLDGKGETGYRYYEAAPEGGYRAIKKKGTYVENLLDGPFAYEAESGNGNVFSWNMEAKAGVTVLSESWEYSQSQKEYRLYAECAPDRPYILSEDRADDVMWNNLILWMEVD